MDIQKAIEALHRSLTHITEIERALVERALRMAEEAHREQKREDGSPYVGHLITVAEILASWHADGETIAAGLLHDILEDTAVTADMLLEQFGTRITALVVGVTKFTQADFEGKEHLERKTETLRKLFEVMRADIRVALIKLADRLHNVRTMETFPEERRKRFAQETLQIYHPIAYHLGMHDVRREFSDRCMPWGYSEETKELQQARTHALTMIEQDLPHIEDVLRQYDTDRKIVALRPYANDLYSLMLSKQRGEELQAAYLVALVQDADACYDILKILHGLYRPISGKFRDFIAVRDNYYQSLHTTVIGPHEQLIPVRIRTEEMDLQERQGILHGWVVRHEGMGDHAWLDRAGDLDHYTRESSKEFWDALQSDIFQESIQVTVNGQNVSVPTGSTALDAMYAAVGRKANRLSNILINQQERSSGTTILFDDVMQAEFSILPKVAFEWLHAVTTRYARSLIVASLKERDQDEKIALGQQLLQREFDHFRQGLVTDLSRVQRQKSADYFKRGSFEDVLAMIGEGVLEARDAAFYLFPEKRSVLPFRRPPTHRSFELAIYGVHDAKHNILSQISAIARMHNAVLHDTSLHTHPQKQTFELHITGTCPDRLHFADFLASLERQEGVSSVTTLLSNPQRARLIGSVIFAFSLILIDVLLIPLFQRWSISLSLFPWFLARAAPLIPIFAANHYLLLKLQRAIPWMRKSHWMLGVGFFMNIVGIVLVIGLETTAGVPTGSLIPYVAAFLFSMLYLGYRFFQAEAVIGLSKQREQPLSSDEWSIVKRRKIVGYIFRTLAVVIWGVFPLSLKYTATADLDPFVRVFIISAGGLCITFLFWVIKSLIPGQSTSLKIKHNWYLNEMIIGQIGLLYFAGLSLLFTSSTNYLLLQNFAPCLALMIALVLWRHSIPYLRHPKHIVWILVIFLMGSTGSSLIIYNTIHSLGPGTVRGDLLSLITMCFDTLLVIAQIRYLKLVPNASGLAINFFMFASICILFLPILLLFPLINPDALATLAQRTIIAGLATGGILGLGEILNYEAFRRIDGFIAFLMFNVSILITFVFEVLFLGKLSPTALLLLGGAIIISSTILAEIVNSRCERRGL